MACKLTLRYLVWIGETNRRPLRYVSHNQISLSHRLLLVDSYLFNQHHNFTFCSQSQCFPIPLDSIVLWYIMGYGHNRNVDGGNGRHQATDWCLASRLKTWESSPWRTAMIASRNCDANHTHERKGHLIPISMHSHQWVKLSGKDWMRTLSIVTRNKTATEDKQESQELGCNRSLSSRQITLKSHVDWHLGLFAFLPCMKANGWFHPWDHSDHSKRQCHSERRADRIWVSNAFHPITNWWCPQKYYWNVHQLGRWNQTPVTHECQKRKGKTPTTRKPREVCVALPWSFSLCHNSTDIYFSGILLNTLPNCEVRVCVLSGKWDFQMGSNFA